MEKNKKIFIVDDHELYRDGLKFFLDQVSEMQVIGEAADGEKFLSMLDVCKPDVVLMDISMPNMDGIEATKEALKKFPELKIIALSSFGDEAYYKKMIEAGVMGFVLKEAGKNEIEEAIHYILDGKHYFSRELLHNIVFKKDTNQEDLDKRIGLSKREKEVLTLICQGFSNNEIAEKLFISPKTVNNHRTHLIEKTATRNSANLVMFAMKNGLIEI